MKDSKETNVEHKIFNLFDGKYYNADLAKLKEDHRKSYVKQKHQEYKQKWKKQTLRFSATELNELSDLAQHYGCNRADFLKACIFAYINDLFVLPDDSQVRMLENGINGIAQSVNSTVRYIHQNNELAIEDIEQIKQQIHHLEIKVANAFRTPPKLKLWLQDQINNDDRFIIQLKEILKDIENDH